MPAIDVGTLTKWVEDIEMAQSLLIQAHSRLATPEETQAFNACKDTLGTLLMDVKREFNRPRE